MPLKQTKYCFRTPLFPRVAYIGLLIVRQEQNIIGFHPLSQVFNSIADFSAEIYNLIPEIQNQELIIDEAALLVSIRFLKQFPLKSKYWRKPLIHYDSMERMKLFVHATHYHEFHNVLVTPMGYENGKEFLSPAIPLPKTATGADIERFMLFTDYLVDQSANSAAVYSLGIPQGIIWKSGDVIPGIFAQKTDVH